MDNVFYRKMQKGFGLRGLLKRLAGNRRMVIALVVGVPILLFVLFGNRGIVQRFRLQSQKAEIEQKVLEAAAENRRLQAESKALDADKKAIEKVAREKYGMIRDGETVYKVRKK
jgi:cell division protein FtsB